MNTMKSSFTLILIFTFTISFSQSERKNDNAQNDSIFIGNCESGAKLAVEDAKRGIYKSYTFGLITRFENEDDWKFREFYEEFMNSKYGILIIEGGCVITEKSICYSKKMNELI